MSVLALRRVCVPLMMLTVSLGCNGTRSPMDATLGDVVPVDAGFDATTADGTDVSVPDVANLHAPQLVAPLTSATVNAHTPTLHWLLPTTATSAQVDVCSDRPCAHVEQTFPATGFSGAPPQALGPGVHFWRIRDASGTTPTWWFSVRHQVVTEAQTSWGSVPDVNGDGLADVLVAANHGGDQLGRVDVYYGSTHGLAATPDVSLNGTQMNGHFGWWVASAGDVNGDGFVDVAVGAPDVSATGSSNDGLAYLYLGSAAGLSATPSQTLVPSDHMANFGSVATGVGDVNGDGFGDVMITAPNANVTTGRAYLFLGSATGLPATPSQTFDGPGGSGSAFGTSLNAAGDVNGDGLADVIVGGSGAASGAGQAYVYLGTPAGLAPAPAATMTSLDPAAQFGSFVGGAGDVNGDGFADVVVGATAEPSGSAFVFLGGHNGISTTPAASIDGPGGLMGGFGWSSAFVGDVNGDGYDDFATGAICAMFGVTDDGGGYPHCGPGMLYIFYGGSGGLGQTASLTIAGPEAGEGVFGWSIAGAGDVDGDGFPDLLASAYALNMFSGAAYLFLGGAGGLSPTPAFTAHGAPSSSENLGWSVALASAPARGPHG